MLRYPSSSGFLHAFVAVTFFAGTATAQQAVLTRSNNNGRTGENTQVPSLYPQSVQSSMQFLHALWTADQVYAQPLYVPAVQMHQVSGGQYVGPTFTANLLVVADMSNTVYVFDADSYGLYWTHQYATPINCNNTGIPRGCGNYTGNVGISGTPVVAPLNNGFSNSYADTAYFVTRTPANPNVTYTLWAVDLGTGSTVAQTNITGSVQSASGTQTFNPYYENQRAALGLFDGQIYVAFGSYNDSGPYHGWLFSYGTGSNNSITGLTGVFDTTPNGGGGGIWQSGMGPAQDEWGNVYVTTGNGATDATDFSEAILQFSSQPPAFPSDFWPSAAFTAPTFPDLNKWDKDLGASGPLITPNAGYGFSILQVGKNGTLYNLLGPNNFGATIGATPQMEGIYGDPSANMTSNGAWLAYNVGAFSQEHSTYYAWTAHDYLRGYVLDGSGQVASISNSTTSTVQSPNNQPGGAMSISTDLTCAVNCPPDGTVVWATQSTTGGNPGSVSVPGELVAFGANLGAPLWKSTDSWELAKWNPPTVADGQVFVPTFSGGVVAYGVPPAQASVFVMGTGTPDHLYRQVETLHDGVSPNQNYGSWIDWGQMGSTQELRSPTSVSWGPGRVDVFALDNGHMRHAAIDPSCCGCPGPGAPCTDDWSPLTPDGSWGFNVQAAPVAVSWAPGRIDLFAVGCSAVSRGNDCSIFQRSWQSGIDSGWINRLDTNGTLTYFGIGAAVGVSFPGTQHVIDIFAIGSDMQSIEHAYYYEAPNQPVGSGSFVGWNTWLGPQSGVYLNARPGVASWGPGRADVMVVDTSGGLWDCGGDNGVAWGKCYAWTPPFGLTFGGQQDNGPTATAFGPGQLLVSTRGSDGQLWMQYWNKGPQPWFPAGGGLNGAFAITSSSF
jgi:hypothetical protein